ncbi:MAG: glycoside hydrolase family 2 TIM barrel-domain containing protein [Bryobacteraceae bacterium]|nr:glycoside hydrolase family 2 TIM barrel-domain containing protein [Bryobacteraceae bacterium]
MDKRDIPTGTSDFDGNAIPSPGRRKALMGLAGFTAASLLAEAEDTPRKLARNVAPGAKAPAPESVAPGAREQSFDAGWLFRDGDSPSAEKPGYNDAPWRTLDLPHDWSIEDLPMRAGAAGKNAPGTNTPVQVGPFDSELSPGKESTGWVVGGTGWYRKHFSVATLPPSARVEIVFDGVYMNADVWLNGEHLGNHPYGYTGFAFDLTPHLKRGGDNVLAVRVRNEGQNSRWYSGSGIYRHVWLTVTRDVRIPLWGVQVTTPEVSAASAVVKVAAQVENLGSAATNVGVRLRLLDPRGVNLGVREELASLEKNGQSTVALTLPVTAPKLWSPRKPQLYRAEVEIVSGGTVLDRVSVPFGIRSIEVDAERGLRINGEVIKLKGGCLHHDNGVLGSAAIDRAEERRVELMKQNGFNAIRTSHNPPSPAFLDACDRLGMVVIDEAFDMWKRPKNPEDYHVSFEEWSERDIESMVRRDGNHPSVVFWSIGNEIPERGDPEGVAIAARLAAAVKRLDSSRPITAAICHFWENGGRPWAESAPAFASLDVGGYNYEWRNYEPDHERYPQRVMMGTESFAVEAFENWQMVEKHPYVIGDFVWTGMDYLGESGIGHTTLDWDNKNGLPPFPWFNAWCGDIDLIGGKKPQSYYRDVVWGNSKLEMAVQRPIPAGKTEELSKWGWSDELRSWTWPRAVGKTLKVRVYSTGDQVRLLLNGKEIGVRPVSMETKLRAEFDVPYAPGELKAIALKNGQELAVLAFKTAGKGSKLALKADRTKIQRSRNDLSYVTVEVQDEAGNVVPDAAVPVRFSLKGPAELAGVGNANPNEMASFRQPRRRTFRGRCLAVVRPTGAAGAITLQAEADGLEPATVAIEAR